MSLIQREKTGIRHRMKELFCEYKETPDQFKKCVTMEVGVVIDLRMNELPNEG